MREACAPQLDLSFERRVGRTVLSDRHVSYPFYVTAPLRSRGPAAEVIVQSVSGGLFGGERVAQRVTVGAGGKAVIRMASATVVHDRRSKPAVSQRVVLRVGDGGQLLYLPRSLILLPGSGVVQSTEIVLGQRSAALVQDSFLMHDPAGFLPDERILDSRVIIRNPSGRLLALDRMRIADEVFAAAVPGVVGDYRAFGTVWLLEASEGDAYRALKAALALAAADSDGCYLAMTPLRSGSGAMIRIAARDGGDLDAALAVIRAACIDCLNNRHMPIHAPDIAVAHH